MEFDKPRAESIRFGSFELRPSSGELFRDKVTVKIPPQPYKVLLFLVRNHGRLVTRQEIHEEIWGTETFVDFNKGLNLCIAQIREALGEDAQSPRFIETLPRRGYRFIGEIEPSVINDAQVSDQTDFQTDEEAVQAVPIPESARRINRATVLIGCLAAFLILGTGMVLYFSQSGTSLKGTEKEEKSMLLVLPFENLTNDPAQDYFSDGLTEEMITRLGSMQPKRLGVIARTTALTYKKTGKDIRQIGKELRVDYVLEGSVRREQGRLRITSQLIKVEDQTHLWAETFDRDESAMLDIQQEVAARIAASLKLELLPSFSLRSEPLRSSSPVAYDAYLKGRYLITKDTPDDLKRSLPYFDQAIAEDPQFAPAYAAEVEALVLLADWTGTIASSDFPKAKAAALKAVALDPSYSEGYAALASVQFWLEWNRTDAGENFKRAVELNPNNPLTRINYGRWLLAQGQTEAGAGEINEALGLDPVSLLTNGLAAYANLNAGRYDQAIALSRRMLELEPKSPAARDCLFRAFINLGDYPGASAILRERMKLNWANEAELKRLDGDPKKVIEDKLRRDLADMKAAANRGEPTWTMYAAWISVKLGEKDEAFRWLEKALNERASFLLYLDIDPTWNTLRPDPRFASLKEKISSNN